MEIVMPRLVAMFGATLSTISLLSFGIGKDARAQTVMGAGTPANCVQNAPNGELACGQGSTAAPGTGATAIGIGAKATADAAMAFGQDAIASSISAMAFGKGANASSTGAVAVGQGATATGTSAVAVGFAARALANGAIAISDVATAQGANSIAIGNNASAAFASSVALGANAQATVANQMMFGTATSIYTLPGVNSAASRSAQKGALRMLTVDSNGNVATAPIPSCRRCPPPPKGKTRPL